MAFQNLRNNNNIFILHKDSTPTLEIGKILNVSIPIPKYGNLNIYNPEMTVDVAVDINGTTNNFLKLPANGEIADFGNNMVVSCSKDAMNSEILAMKLKSLDIINSVDIHKQILKGCDVIVLQLNPEIAEKLKQDAENRALREELNSLKDMFKEFMNFNKLNNGNNNRSTEREN